MNFEKFHTFHSGLSGLCASLWMLANYLTFGFYTPWKMDGNFIWIVAVPMTIVLLVNTILINSPIKCFQMFHLDQLGFPRKHRQDPGGQTKSQHHTWGWPNKVKVAHQLARLQQNLCGKANWLLAISFVLLRARALSRATRETTLF